MVYNVAKISKRVTITDTETGEIIRDSVSYGSQNGVDWMIVYKEAYRYLLIENTNPSVLRVFGLLMTKQEFEKGIKATKKSIADELKISYDSVMIAFKWLKENGYVKEHKVDGITEFVLNPDVTTCGKNRKAKIDLWNSIP